MINKTDKAILLVFYFLVFMSVAHAATVDSYSSTNYDDFFNDAGDQHAQSFTSNGSAYTLTGASFYLKKPVACVGNIYVKLYSHTGTYGVSSAPNSLLATSDPLDCSTITGSFTSIYFNFSGGEQYSMTLGTHYVMAVDASGIGATAFQIGMDTTASTHDGNEWNTTDGATATYDLIFTIEGDAIAPPPPPDTSSLQYQLSAASSSIGATTGYDIQTLLRTLGGKMFVLFAGAEVAILGGMKAWIVALLIIAVIVYFASRAFRFFRH